MFLTEYYTFDNKYYCRIKEVISEQENIIIEYCGDDLDEVFVEAIMKEEEYYDYEFSNTELEIMRETADIEILLRENPDDLDLFDEYVDLQGKLQVEYIKTGYEDIRKFKDVLLAS